MESYPRYYGLVGTFSCVTAPARGTRGAVLLGAVLIKTKLAYLQTKKKFHVFFSKISSY
jgi:hypothetical protein